MPRIHFSFNIVPKKPPPCLTSPLYVKQRIERKSTSHFLLFPAALLKAQPHDGFVLIVLIDPDVAQRLTQMGMVEYILNRDGIMRLLVHMIAERLP